MGNTRKMIYIGIDPGITGAIAINDDKIEVHPMPTIAISKTKRDYNIHKIVKIFIDIKKDLLIYPLSTFSTFIPPKIFVVIEEGGVMPKEGRVSSYKTGRGLGIIEGIVSALQLPFVKVKPCTWKREMLKDCAGDDPKGKAILQAERLFPEVSLYRTDKCKKPDHNYADALLLMEYGRRISGGENEKNKRK
ncbi:MAG: hypothetical protein AB1397_07745 [bacterium]